MLVTQREAPLSKRTCTGHLTRQALFSHSPPSQKRQRRISHPPPNTHNRQNDQAYGSLTLRYGRPLIATQAQRRSASPESTVPVTVPRSVSRSRRWRCAHPAKSPYPQSRAHNAPDHTTRPLRVSVLRQERRQAHRRRYLELPILQEDHRWRSLHRLVSAPALTTIALAAPDIQWNNKGRDNADQP
jgi:hypothetical protein